MDLSYQKLKKSRTSFSLVCELIFLTWMAVDMMNWTFGVVRYCRSCLRNMNEKNICDVEVCIVILTNTGIRRYATRKVADALLATSFFELGPLDLNDAHLPSSACVEKHFHVMLLTVLTYVPT